MIDIFLSDTSKNILKIPVPPKDKMLNNSYNNKKFESTIGTIKLLGNKNPSSFSISSFFPSKPNKYSFDKSNKYTAKEYVKIIENWGDKKIYVRVITTGDLEFNKLMSIEKFDYGVKDGTGDIYYTLQLEELIIPNIIEKKV